MMMQLIKTAQRVVIRAAFAAAVAILGIGFSAPSALAITIYSDALTGSGSALHGTTVDSSVTYAGSTAGATWTAAGSYNQTTTGTIGTDAKQGAYLPFTPQAGYVYTLTATLEYPIPNSNWAALGFQTQADVASGAFHDASGSAYAWVLVRGSGQPQFFLGPDTASGVGFATASQCGLQTVTITLDTRGASWTTSATIGGYTSSRTYSSNPTSIAYVGFGGTGSISKTINFSLSAVSANPPVITATGSPLSALTTTYGTASAPANFTVSGAYMTAGILVTAPTGFEVSQSSGSGYAATNTVAGFGTIGNTTVYVRLAATAPIGTYNSQNIVLTSSGATPVNVTTASDGNSVTKAATKLAITSTAVSTIAGVASGTITVQRQDEYSSPVTAGPSISVTLSSDSAGTVTFSPSSLTIAYGASSATFTYTDTKAGTPTITAASSSLTSATQVETVTPASATKLTFGVQPSTTGEGLAITPPVTVLVQDEYGNTVTGDSSSVTIGSATTTFTGDSTLSANASSGVATFGNLKPMTAGLENTLTANDGSLAEATSSEFVVLAGLPDHFAFSTISSPQTAGTPITGITITAQNADNSTMTTFVGTVTYGGSAGITGTSASFVNGELTSVSVTPTVAGSDKTFTVTVGAVTSTSTFNVNPGALDHFAISAISTPQAAGTAVTGVTLTAKDAHANTVTSFTGTVDYSGTAGITGTSVAFTDGVLSGVSVTPITAGSGKTFIVTDSVSGKTGTRTFDVNAGALDHFAIVGIPASATAGSALMPITVTAQDANNNTVLGFTGTVAYSGTALITGTSVAFTDGVLSDVSVTPTVAGTGLTLIVTDAISGKTGTGSFDVVPGALDHFAISTIPSPQTAGTAISDITLTALDVYTNTLSTGPNAFTGTVAYSGTAGITGTSANFIDGVLSGVSVTPTVAGSGKTLIVTDPISAKTGTRSFDVDSLAVSAASSTVVASPTNVVANGTSASTITVTLRDVYNNGVSNKTVTLVSSRGAADTITAASGPSSAAGVVTFTVKSTTPGESVFSATDVTDSSLAITQTAIVDWVVNLAAATGVFVHNTVAGGDGTLATSAWPALGAYSSVSGNPWSDLTDGSTSTSWIQNWGVADAGNSGFYMTLPVAVVMQGIRFSTADVPGRSPKTMTIEGSFATGTDLLVGANWTPLYSGTAGMDTALSYSPGNKVSFVNKTAYTSYRVLFLTTIAHKEVQVSDIIVFGVPYKPPQGTLVLFF